MQVTRWRLQILNPTIDEGLMAVCLLLVGLAFSCQDNFPGGAEEWYHYIRNFTVNNMVVIF